MCRCCSLIFLVSDISLFFLCCSNSPLKHLPHQHRLSGWICFLVSLPGWTTSPTLSSLFSFSFCLSVTLWVLSVDRNCHTSWLILKKKTQNNPNQTKNSRLLKTSQRGVGSLRFLQWIWGATTLSYRLCCWHERSLASSPGCQANQSEWPTAEPTLVHTSENVGKLEGGDNCSPTKPQTLTPLLPPPQSTLMFNIDFH